jgi:hypothetical protein
MYIPSCLYVKEIHICYGNVIEIHAFEMHGFEMHEAETPVFEIHALENHVC